jgi:uncharacterized protein (DUF1330 family)
MPRHAHVVAPDRRRAIRGQSANVLEPAVGGNLDWRIRRAIWDAAPLAAISGARYGRFMAALAIVTYDVSDPDRFAEYNPGSVEEIIATMTKYGGQPIAAGAPDVVMGSTEQVAVCVSFPDAESARAWFDDDEYAPYKAIRHESTTNIREYIVPGFG